MKTGVIFEAANNKKRAKEFVSFLLQEENLTLYVEWIARDAGFPVTAAGQKSAFWQAYRHRQSVFNQYAAGTVTLESHLEELQVHHSQ